MKNIGLLPDLTMTYFTQDLVKLYFPRLHSLFVVFYVVTFYDSFSFTRDFCYKIPLKNYGKWQEDLNLLSHASEAGMLTIRLCSSTHDIKEKISEYMRQKSQHT